MLGFSSVAELWPDGHAYLPMVASRSITRWSSLTRITVRWGYWSVATVCAVTRAGWRELRLRWEGSAAPWCRKPGVGTHHVEPVQHTLDDARGKRLAAEPAHVLGHRDVLRQGRLVHRDHVWCQPSMNTCPLAYTRPRPRRCVRGRPPAAQSSTGTPACGQTGGWG